MGHHVLLPHIFVCERLEELERGADWYMFLYMNFLLSGLHEFKGGREQWGGKGLGFLSP